MYTNTSRNDFIDTFAAIGRMDKEDGNGGNFTIDALHALFDYMEDLEDSIGEPMQFDPIGICCDFCEYGSATEAVRDINDSALAEIKAETEHADSDDAELVADEIEDACLEWLNDRTHIIEFPFGVIIGAEI